MSPNWADPLSPSQQPEAKEAADRRADAFRRMSAANSKVSRCRREDSLAAAREEAQRARADYEKARDDHDALMRMLIARQVQRGWSPT